MRRVGPLVALVVVLAACTEHHPTAPPPVEPIGTPLTLTAEVDPTTISHTGGAVRLVAAITVAPGTRMPSTLSVKVPGTEAASLLSLSGEGRLDERLFLTSGGDLVVNAGGLERRIPITQTPQPDSVPNPPPSAPTPPPNLPDPPLPTPMPTDLNIELSIAPTPVYQDVAETITATVTPLAGGAAIPGTGVQYDWAAQNGSGWTVDQATHQNMGDTDVLNITFTGVGARSVGVLVTLPDGRRAYQRIDLSITIQP